MVKSANTAFLKAFVNFSLIYCNTQSRLVVSSLILSDSLQKTTKH